MLLAAIFVVITILYAILMFRDRVPTVGWVVLGLLWLGYVFINKRMSYTSPIDMPILGLLCLIPFSLVISTDQALTLPKVYALILGIALFYVIANSIQSLKRLQLVFAGLIVLAFAIPVLGLIGADWNGSGFSLPTRILARLPVGIDAIHNLTASGGVHVNTIGGALAFFAPMLLALLWDGGTIKKAFTRAKSGGSIIFLLYKLILVIALALVLGEIVLTQSRAAILGVAAGFLVLAILKNKRFLLLIPILLVLGFVVLQVYADGNLEQLIALLDTTQENDTLPMRMEYWQRTVYLIQDFPLTGTGIGTYGRIFHDLYTFTPFEIQGESTFYAHNMYLAVAANTGIPGLVLYFALIASFFAFTLQTLRNPHPLVKVLSIGLGCGLLANLVFGIFDNFMLGEKLGIILWIFLGCAAALHVHRDKFAQPEIAASSNPKWQKTGRDLRNLGLGLFIWLLVSLAAVAFININPYISLAVALIGGVLLGMFQFQYFKTTLPTSAHIQQNPSAA